MNERSIHHPAGLGARGESRAWTVCFATPRLASEITDPLLPVISLKPRQQRLFPYTVGTYSMLARKARDWLHRPFGGVTAHFPLGGLRKRRHRLGDADLRSEVCRTRGFGDVVPPVGRLSRTSGGAMDEGRLGNRPRPHRGVWRGVDLVNVSIFKQEARISTAGGAVVTAWLRPLGGLAPG